MSDNTISSETDDSAKAVSYPKLPPRAFASMSAEEYIDQRLNQAIEWYDAKSKSYKFWYLFMRAATVIGGAVVPVLVNLDFPHVKVITTFISLMVVLFVSLESVYHFREQWKNYRSTEQLLRKEYFLFVAKEGSYESSKNVEEAFRLFVEHVEGAIDTENASTLQVLTTVSEPKRGRDEGSA
jgi:hypothetical protein